MKAINIALLLPIEERKKILKLNQSIHTEKQLIDFLHDGSIPYVTLYMIVCSEKKLDEISKNIDYLLDKHNPIVIKYKALNIGNTLTDIKIEKSNEILSLHNDICAMCEKFKGRPAIPINFYDPSSISTKTCQSVQFFYYKSAKDKFQPHVTIGSGTPTIKQSYNCFKSSKLVIGHLSNYGTIKRILKEWTIGP